MSQNVSMAVIGWLAVAPACGVGYALYRAALHLF